MDQSIRDLPVSERIQLVEDIWDSIAVDQNALPLTEEQKRELDRRLETYRSSGSPGRPAREAIEQIRKRL
ncbi:MAG: addiction module protein [Armatimonadetes bacterium]|nr:addiction module protein [Armatimonadota bacterium]